MTQDKTPASFAALSEDRRSQAMARLAVLRPHLDDGVPLTRTAAAAGVPLRTAQRLAHALPPGRGVGAIWSFALITLRIDHRSTYRYRQPVSLGPHRLMLRPRKSRDVLEVKRGCCAPKWRKSDDRVSGARRGGGMALFYDPTCHRGSPSIPFDSRS